MKPRDQPCTPGPAVARDVEVLLDRFVGRRSLLRWLAAAGAMPWAAPRSASAVGCATTPGKTEGPFPADGSNGNARRPVNALALSGIVRSDIRTSVAGASGTATGVALAVRLALVGTRSRCAALANHGVYVWHCTSDGLYSMYSPAIASENYLRGIQVTDASGLVEFQTVFPGCYPGRMPHIHFEVYPSLADAARARGRLATSQLAFPRAPCDAVYARPGYGSSARHFAHTTFADDFVFGDGVEGLLAEVRGDPASGFQASLEVGVAA